MLKVVWSEVNLKSWLAMTSSSSPRFSSTTSRMPLRSDSSRTSAMPVMRPSRTTSTIFSMIAVLRTWYGISVTTIWRFVPRSST